MVAMPAIAAGSGLPRGRETDNCLFNFGQRAPWNNLAHCVDQTTLMQRAWTLHVEAELDDVAFLDGVFFAFDAELSGFAGFGLGADRFDRRLYVTHCAHMTTITIRELHMKTGQWVRAAARGKRGLLVLDRGRPAARLLPAEEEAGVEFSQRKLVRGFNSLPELSVDSAHLLEEDRR
jgi:antitoxin (DNA-binding transcriptional repressor) of toxin-antitoxin stability system